MVFDTLSDQPVTWHHSIRHHNEPSLLELTRSTTQPRARRVHHLLESCDRRMAAKSHHSLEQVVSVAGQRPDALIHHRIQLEWHREPLVRRAVMPNDHLEKKRI